MRKYDIYQVDVFTTKAFEGNPAAVVPHADGLTDQDMQHISREMNLSETSFILPSRTKDIRIRWFTPVKEVLFCGHATVASFHVLAEKGLYGMDQEGTFTFIMESMIGAIPVEVKKTKKTIEITLTAPKSEFTQEKIDKGHLAKALRIREEDIDQDLPIMRDKTIDYIYVPIRRLNVLKTIDYDYDLLKILGDKTTIKSFVFFTLETFDKKSQVHCRVFSPYYGVKEDPVTGSAQGPLGIYLCMHNLIPSKGNVIHLQSEQGDCMGRPGRVKITIQREKDGSYSAAFSGSAYTILKGTLAW
jgi:trans-2,3-dihydro-3-hydroxyanthranilate isomerase